MSDPAAVSFGPYVFVLSDDEAAAAAARFGLRSALAGGLTRGYLAPLAAFALGVFFAATLALTGLITRRHGEEALLIAAAAYMASRMLSHWRLHRARRESLTAIAAIRGAGPLTARVDPSGIEFAATVSPRRWDFARCVEAEDAGGMIYLWPKHGAPACIPTRILAGDEAQRLLAFLRARIAAR
jgi:hypothetical protein